jgi:hypothetical protein
LESERSSCIGSSCSNQFSAKFRLSFSGNELNFSPLQRTLASISFTIKVSYCIEVVGVEGGVEVPTVEAGVDVAGVEGGVDVAGNEGAGVVVVVVVIGVGGFNAKYNDTPTITAKKTRRSKPTQIFLSLKVVVRLLFSGC